MAGGPPGAASKKAGNAPASWESPTQSRHHDGVDGDDGDRGPSRLIRDGMPIVISHRPNDYHPDHRYVGVFLDAAYMTVPHFWPTRPTRKIRSSVRRG
jgi:LmbE family N-acetylglucosaminyl deacetylase